MSWHRNTVIFGVVVDLDHNLSHLVKAKVIIMTICVMFWLCFGCGSCADVDCEKPGGNVFDSVQFFLYKLLLRFVLIINPRPMKF